MTGVQTCPGGSDRRYSVVVDQAMILITVCRPGPGCALLYSYRMINVSLEYSIVHNTIDNYVGMAHRHVIVSLTRMHGILDGQLAIVSTSRLLKKWTKMLRQSMFLLGKSEDRLL